MKPLLREILEDNFIADFKSNNLLGLDLEFPEHLQLIKVEGAAIKDPPVQAAVGLAEPLLDQVDHNIVGHYNKVNVTAKHI